MAQKNEDFAADTEITTESLAVLKNCRNWRSAKFALVRHGAEIVSLAVNKKSVGKAKREALDNARGKVFFGTLRGDEEGFCFEIANSDGFDSVPPVPPARLKKFLRDHGIRNEVRYSMVDTPEYEGQDEAGD